MRSRLLIALCAGGLLLPRLAFAYEETPTHQHLTSFAIPLLRGDASYDEISLYSQVLEDATVAEDEKARCLHHFYDPTTHLGLPTNTLTRFYYVRDIGVMPRPALEEGGRYTNSHFMSAAIWARDGMPDKLDFEGAIAAYGDPTLGEKGHEAAWRALGHVLHLVQDMCQPDHARDRPHPGNYLPSYLFDPGHPLTKRYGYESLWAKLGDQWPHGEKVRDLDSLEKAFDDAATFSQTTETSFGVPLAHEYALGLGDVVASRSAGSAAFSQSIRDHSAGIVTDALWAEYEIHLAVQPLITLDPPNASAKIYTELGKTLLPAAEEFTAGMLRLFYRIVKPPPIVEAVTLTQDGESAPRYRAKWETGTSGRTLKVDGSGELVAGKKIRVRVEFGPSITLKGTVFKEQIGHPKVTIDVAGKPPVNVDEDALLIADGVWEGHFFATESGTLRIEASDLDIHFTRRNFPGGELDSDPATIARAGAKAPYDWKDYTPGADRNHSFRIAGGCPPAAVSADLRKKAEWGEISGTWKIDKTYEDGIRDPQNVKDPSWEWSGSWTETVKFRARVHWEPGSQVANFGHLLDGSDEEKSGSGVQRGGRVKRIDGALTLTGADSGKYFVGISHELDPVDESKQAESRSDHGRIFPRIAALPIAGRICSDSSLQGTLKVADGKPDFVESRAPTQFSLKATSPYAKKRYETAKSNWNLSIKPAALPQHVEICARDFDAEKRSSGEAAFHSAVVKAASSGLGVLYRTGRTADAQALAPMFAPSPESQAALRDLRDDRDHLSRDCKALGGLWISSDHDADARYETTLKSLQNGTTDFSTHDHALAEVLAGNAEKIAAALAQADPSSSALLRDLATRVRAKGAADFAVGK